MPNSPALPKATDSLTMADVMFLRQLVLERSAIVLDDSKHYLLASRLEPVVRRENLASIAELVANLRKQPRGRLETIVIEAMTTNETSFFRDLHPFTALTEVIIPEILAERGPAAGVTIWCGASSSGQEPYSIAVAVADKFPELMSAGRLRIVATDIAPSMVDRTKAGRFSQLEVNRGLPVRQLIRFFQQDGNEWVANRELRQTIDVRLMNLVGPWANMPKCDIVFLRNVLIYFSADTKRQILERIRRDVLRPGGQLFLGSSETTLNIDNAWERRSIGRSISYVAPGGDVPRGNVPAAPGAHERASASLVTPRPLAAPTITPPRVTLPSSPSTLFPNRPAGTLPPTPRR
jgi:chemotaxis protein methyltransferase CheR